MRSGGILLIWVAALLLGRDFGASADACCAVTHLGKQVINADQSVIILWDADAKRQHFIRQAKFETDAHDIGFLIPSPSQPELAEAGDDAFTHLKDRTAAEVIHVGHGGGGDGRRVGGCGCSSGAPIVSAGVEKSVRVLEERRVAGFDAVVLEADGTDELTAWLEEHGYAFSPEVAAWAAPYVEEKWKFTALKVAKPADGEQLVTIAAGALRMSFDTDRPLFPYREPEYKDRPDLGAKDRLLQIFFISDARYEGGLTPDAKWTGEVAWAGKLSDMERTALLARLKLPPETGPREWFLTEFEDHWKFNLAPADVYFAPDTVQTELQRPDVIISGSSRTDGTLVAVFGLTLLYPLWRRMRVKT